MRRLSLVLFAFLWVPGSTVAAESSESCLRLKDVDSISYERDTSAMVNRGSDNAYLVTFANACGYSKSNDILTYTDLAMGRCLEHGDVLRVTNGGSCFVDTVAPVSQSGGD